MAASYLKLFVDSLEKYQKLNDGEFGRLVRAALRYKATGAEPDDLGREALLWDGMRLDIDRDAEKYERTVAVRSEAGKKGGRPKKQKKQMLFLESKKSQDKDKDKDKDKEEDIAPLLSPQGEVAQAQPAEMSLPLISGALYPIYPADVDHWKQLYPSVDIRKELRKMLGWLEANPTRQKTQKGIKRFVAAWLAKEQDKAPPKTPASYDIDEMEEMSKFNLPEEI